MIGLGDRFYRDRAALSLNDFPFYCAVGIISIEIWKNFRAYPIKGYDVKNSYGIPHIKFPTKTNSVDFWNLNVFAISIDEIKVYGYPRLLESELQKCISFIAEYQQPLMDFYNDDITFKQLKGIINKNGG